MSERLTNAWYPLFALAVASIFALVTFGYTTPNPIRKDAGQNTRAAYHLVHAGVISIDHQESRVPDPQMRREPLPILATAGFLLLHPAFDQHYTIQDLLNGRLTETVKGVNAFWRFLAAIFLFLLCREVFPDSRVAAMMAVVCLTLSESFFLSRPGVVDRMYTELPEVALMLLASWSAVRFVHSKTTSRALWLGVALGLLALCKTSFLYIGLGFVILLLVTDRAKQFQTSPEKRAWDSFLVTYAAITLAMLATIAPWIARNAIEFRTPQISSGPETAVLGIRMLMTLTGYTKQDLLPGGRLARLSAVKDEKWELLKERMVAEGYKGESGKWVKRAALDAAMQNPLRYIESIGVFAYKGMWFMTRAGPMFNLVAVLAFFGVFFAALVTRNQVLLAAFGLPAGLFFFISTFTHALTRYTMPMTPFVILSVLWLIAALARQAYRRFPRFRTLVDPCLRLIQRPSDAKSSSQRRPTTPTSSAETASRA
jgi:hypothetical protein